MAADTFEQYTANATVMTDAKPWLKRARNVYYHYVEWSSFVSRAS